MAEFIEILTEDSKVQNEKTQTIEKYNKESCSTQSKIGQNSLIQSKVFEQAINFIGYTTEDMDLKIGQKDFKIELLENQIGLTDSKIIDGMNRLGENKRSPKRKGHRIMDGDNNSPNNHKDIKNKKINLKFLIKRFTLILTFL